jgi:hypothetical protein
MFTLTKHAQDIDKLGRDRPDFNSTHPSRCVENLAHLDHEGGSVLGQFGDLTLEANRVAYIEAMILDRVIPLMDGKPGRLEAAFMKLPRRTMNELIATQRKLYEAFRKDAAVVSDDLKRRYIS